MSELARQNVPRSYPRELAIAIMTTGLAALYILAIGDAIGPRQDRLSPSDFPESTRNKVDRARVKIVRLNGGSTSDKQQREHAVAGKQQTPGEVVTSPPPDLLTCITPRSRGVEERPGIDSMLQWISERRR